MDIGDRLNVFSDIGYLSVKDSSHEFMYGVGVEDEASPAFAGHRYDVVILADILVREARSLQPIIAKVMRAKTNSA